MNKLILFLAGFLFLAPAFDQEEEEVSGGGNEPALIADIMNVDPVNAATAVSNEEANAEYQEVYDKEKSNIDGSLGKLGETYKKDVQSLIEKFSKVLSNGIESEVNIEKQRVATKVNALTIALRKNKKNETYQFQNACKRAIQEMPKDLRKNKLQELDKTVKELMGGYDDEFKANQTAITQFKATEHLLEGADAIPDAPAEEESSEN